MREPRRSQRLEAFRALGQRGAWDALRTLDYKKSGRKHSVLLSEATEDQKLDWLAYRRAERTKELRQFEQRQRDADDADVCLLGLADTD